MGPNMKPRDSMPTTLSMWRSANSQTKRSTVLRNASGFCSRVVMS